MHQELLCNGISFMLGEARRTGDRWSSLQMGREVLRGSRKSLQEGQPIGREQGNDSGGKMRLAIVFSTMNWPIGRRRSRKWMQERGLTPTLAGIPGEWKTLMLPFIAALGLVLGSSVSVAQSGAGAIQGTVTDSTGAVIPGAAIHVANQDTGVGADTKSSAAGSYQVPGLFTGTYIVTVTAPGMETYQRTIDLLAGQTATINPSLTPGAVTQKVEVTANSVQLVTTTS